MSSFLNAGIIALTLGYTLSQFYRAFLAVLSSTLLEELGATPGDLALSSGMWFLSFALMQLPVGWALDRIGPRLTAAVSLAVGGGGGAAVFAMATAPWHLHVAMALIGIGCAPALMAAYYIFAHDHPPAKFGMLTGAMVGLGSAGNILGAAPLVSLIHAIGWRPALWLLVGVTLAVAALLAVTVRDPVHHDGPPRGRVGELFTLPAIRLMLPLIFVSYAASAAIRGLWASPYLHEVFGADDVMVGRATLAMGLAMVVGNLAAGPLVRLAGSARRALIAGHAISVATLAALWLAPGWRLGPAIVLLALVGLTGTNYTLLMAHARQFLAPHLVGRGMTLLNMASIGGVGVMQFASRPLHMSASAAYPPAQAYSLLFLFFLLPLILGFAIFLLAPARPPATDPAHG
ncbi:MFS transporter [Paracoccus sphaerophysae]|uniref:MFS transporter n=1 Tax=Paracoccus sphaerophysae TaxID=690417 RepID=A0A099FGX8_9RHOB|nr:MFS transporter [Paracoccus sphaerophysae]KGJ09486.1 MFS transporter [Paracoccus sphaerophysae]